MISFFKETRIDFLGKKNIAYFISLGLFFVSLVTLIVNRGPHYGIDFTGGTLINFQFSKDVQTETIRNVLIELGEFTPVIQKIGGAGSEYIIKVSPKEGLVEGGFTESLVKRVKQRVPGVEVDLRRQETVGPQIGKELQIKAIYAILLGMVGILIYIGLRINIQFGTGAVIALFHDAFITLGILTLLGKEITIPIVAALLTIIGYSVNDSIVVSERIKEKMRFLRGVPLEDVVNEGLNAVLSRTIITSLTTFLVAAALWIFSPLLLKDFALTLMFGVVIGTYSSIFIVAALAVEWERIFPKKKRR